MTIRFNSTNWFQVIQKLFNLNRVFLRKNARDFRLINDVRNKERNDKVPNKNEIFRAAGNRSH